KERDELAPEPWPAHLSGRVAADGAAAREEAKAAANRRQLAGDRRPVEPPVVERGQVGADRAAVDRGEGARPLPRQEGPKLLEVDLVAPDRVRRRVLLDRQVAEEGAHRIGHVTACSASSL